MITKIILVLIIVVLIAGVFPARPQFQSWGYTPTRFLTLVLIIFMIWDLFEGRPLIYGSNKDISILDHDVTDSDRESSNFQALR